MSETDAAMRHWLALTGDYAARWQSAPLMADAAGNVTIPSRPIPAARAAHAPLTASPAAPAPLSRAADERPATPRTPRDPVARMQAVRAARAAADEREEHARRGDEAVAAILAAAGVRA